MEMAAAIGPQLLRGTAISSDMHSTGISDNPLGTGDSLFAGMFEAAAGTGAQAATDAPVLANATTQGLATQSSFAGTVGKAPDLSLGSLTQISSSAVESMPHSDGVSVAPTATDPEIITAPQVGTAVVRTGVNDAAPQPMGDTSNVEAPQVSPKNAVGTIAAQELPAPVAQDKPQSVDIKLLPQSPHESDAQSVSQSENASTVLDGDKLNTSDSEPAVATAVKPNVSALPIAVPQEPLAQKTPAQPETPAQANTTIPVLPEQEAAPIQETEPQPQAPSQAQQPKVSEGTLPAVMPHGLQYAYQAIVRAIEVGSGSDVPQTDVPVKTDNSKSPVSIDSKEDVPQTASFSEENNAAQDNGQDGNLVAAVMVPVLPVQLAVGEPIKAGKDAPSSSVSHSAVHSSSKGSVTGKISHGETGNNVVPQSQTIQGDATVNAMPMTSTVPAVQKQGQEDSVEGSLQTVVAVKTVTTKAVADKFGRPAQVAGKQKTATAKDEKSSKSEIGVAKTSQDVSTPTEKNTSSAGNEAAAPQVAHSPSGHTVDNKLHAVSALKVDTGVNNLQDLAGAPKPAQAGSHDPFARLDAAAGSNAQESGAQWIAAGHRQIEVAIADETHGVMHVRAEKGTDNTVQAVVMASSEFSHEVLKAEAPHMTSFLSQQTVPVDRVQVVRMQENAAMNMDLGGRAQQDRGQQSSGTDAGAEQKKLVWRQVGASPSLSTTSRGLGLLSVRV